MGLAESEKTIHSLLATKLILNQNRRPLRLLAALPLTGSTSISMLSMFYKMRTETTSQFHKAHLSRVAVLIAILFALLLPRLASATDTTERLRTSVARMNDWLGVGEKAQAWRKLLNLNVLDSQAAKGEQADLTTLRSLLNVFDRDDESLKHPVFQEVRSSIKAQIDQLDRTRSQELIDLQFAAQQAVAKFEPPTISKLEYLRDVARYELQLLKKVYRRDYDSRSRAEVFYELKLNDTVDFLGEMKIEMPPEVSVGKMKSMIEDERNSLEKIVDKIDALPMELPEEDEDDENDQDTNIIELSPPVPDVTKEDDLKSLKAQEEALEKRIKELEKKASAVFKKDKPRLIRRRDFGRALRRSQRRFRNLAKEQTDSAFASARAAVDRFADAYEFSTEDNIQQEYIERVIELADLLPTLSDPNDPLSHAKLGSILQWLEDRHQLNDLCVAIRRKYSGPNTYVSVSSRLIQSLSTRSSAEYDRVAEDFLGRFARGLSYTNTTVNVYPIDDPDQVRVSIVLGGTASTDTYVRQLSFKIKSTASGSLSGRRDLYASLNGLYASESSVDASISAQYGGISSNCGLVQRLAAKSFAEEQTSTDDESSRRVKERLRERFDSETSTAIDDGVEQVETFAQMARKFYALLPQIYLRSFSDRVEAVAKKDTRSAFGATINPSFRTAGSDVQLKLHESMISNYLDLVFAGRTFTNDDLEAEIKAFAKDTDLLGGAAAGDEEIEDFKISFPKVRPIQIEFSENRINVIVTGTRFEQGDNAIKTSLTIKLSFKVVGRDGKLFLQPQGTPEIDLSEGEEPGADSIAFAKILEKRLGEAVESSGSEGIELPSNLIPDVPQLKGVDVINSLQLGLFEMQDGWLYLGWNYQGGTVSTPGIWNELTIEEFEPLYLPEGEPELIEQPPVDESVLNLTPANNDDVILESVLVEGSIENAGVVIGQ